MNQKSFAKVILVAIIIVVLGVVGYLVFIKKPVPGTQEQALSLENNSSPAGILLPADCRVVGSKGDIDQSLNGYILSENEWLIDCGSKNNAARDTLGPILEQQGWIFCDSEPASSRWWKGGIMTSIAESMGASYPFMVSQSPVSVFPSECDSSSQLPVPGLPSTGFSPEEK
jgi:hypothetical protein